MLMADQKMSIWFRNAHFVIRIRIKYDASNGVSFRQIFMASTRRYMCIMWDMSISYYFIDTVCRVCDCDHLHHSSSTVPDIRCRYDSWSPTIWIIVKTEKKSSYTSYNNIDSKVALPTCSIQYRDIIHLREKDQRRKSVWKNPYNILL